jgi:hypothetical protein
VVREHLRRGRALERHAAREQVVQRRAEVVDVGAVVRVAADELFGRGVIGGKRDRRDAIQFRARVFKEFGETEVEHLHEAVAVREQVARLDVAVRDALFVRVLKAGGGLHRVADGFAHWEPAVRREPPVERVALDVLEHEEVRAAVAGHVVGVNDVRVIERGGGAGLVVEPVHVLGFERALGRQHLERDAAAERGVFGEEHLAHAAGPDLVQNAVRPEAEPLVLALQNEARLKRREDAGLHEARGGVGGRGRQRPGAGEEPGERVVVRDLGPAHECEDRVAGDRSFGHTRHP